MKSQMSLEMIVGLLILLVLAAVVISLILKFVRPPPPPPMEPQLKAECERLCNEFLLYETDESAATFCSEKVRDYDWNGNGFIGDSFTALTKLMSVCEDGVYCFHIYECKMKNGEKIDWDDCKSFMCKAYYEVYQN